MKKVFIVILLSGLFLALFPRAADKKALLQQLKNGNSAQKEAAIEAIGNNKISEAIPDLIKIVELNNGTETAKALAAIGKIGDPQAIKSLLLLLLNPKIREYEARNIAKVCAEIDCNWQQRPEVQALCPIFLKEFYQTKNKIQQIFLFQYLIFIDRKYGEELCLYMWKIKGYKYFSDIILKKVRDLEIRKLLIPIFNLFKECYDSLLNENEDYIKTLDALDVNWKKLSIVKKFAAELNIAIKRNRNPDGMINSIEKLFVLQPEAAIPFCIRICQGKKLNEEAWAKSLEILSEIKYQQAFPMFVAGLKSDKSEIKEICIQALAGLKNKKAAEFLLPLLQDSEESTVQYTISSLVELDAKAACPLLIKMLQIAQEDILPEILKALFSLREPRAFELASNFLKKSNEKESDYFRNKIIKLLIPHWNKNQMNEVIDNFHKAKGYEKVLWIKTLANLKDPRALMVLKEAARNENRNVRAYADWAIFHISH